jgi:hypothetical protein
MDIERYLSSIINLTYNLLNMAQFWIAIFFIFLAVAQLYQSIKDINLPLPIYLVLGAMLAVASNAQQQLSFTPAQQPTQPRLDESDPILNSIEAANLVEPLQLFDGNTHPILSAAPPTSPVELADEIPAVNNDTDSIGLAEPLALVTEVLHTEIEPVDSDLLVISTESLLLPTEILSIENTEPIDIETPSVSIAVTEASQVDDVEQIDSDELPVVEEPQPEVGPKKAAKPVARKPSRKKSTSTKTRK